MVGVIAGPTTSVAAGRAESEASRVTVVEGVGGAGEKPSGAAAGGGVPAQAERTANRAGRKNRTGSLRIIEFIVSSGGLSAQGRMDPILGRVECMDYKTIAARRVKYEWPRHLPGRAKQGIPKDVDPVANSPRTRPLIPRIDPPSGIFVAALVVLFGPVLLGLQAVFWGLPLLQFFPWHEAGKLAVLGGRLPLWNPGVGMGAPLLANAQSALLYPPNWLLWILPVEYGQGVLMAAHLLLAGVGMAKLSRALGIGPLGQAAAGLAFMLSGYLASRAWFLTINASAAWLPWILLAGEHAGRRGRGVFSAPLTAALCLQWLAGHWQLSWYTWLLLAGWMTVRASAVRPLARSILLAGARLLTASLLAFALGAAQFLPTVGYWLQSPRAAGVDPGAALTYSFWPWRLITLIAPDFFGNPAHGDYWGYANYWEDAIYVGLLPLGLAATAAASALRRKGVAGFPYGYLLALLPLTLILALGSNTPVFPFLFRSVPTFNLFQAPSRIMIGFVFSLSLLAAAGAEQWSRSEETSYSRAVKFGVAAAAVAMGGLAARFLGFAKPTFADSIAAAGGLGILIAAVWMLKIFSRGKPGWMRVWPAAAAALIAADLIIADYGLTPTTSPDLYRAENPSAAQTAVRLDGRRIYMPEQIRHRLMYDRAFSFETFFGLADWMELRRWELPNVSILDGIPSANNFDSFVLERYAVLTGGLESLPARQRDRLLGMMDVGAVWEWPEGADEPALRYLPEGAARAWGVCRAEWVISAEDAWLAVADPRFDPAQTVVLELGRGEEGGDCPSRPAAAIVESEDPNRLRIDVEFETEGYLVVADMNDQGWEAHLDGERVPVLQADYAFRAVRIPAGTHRVEFRYVPLTFRAGAWISGIAMLLMIAVILFSGRRRAGAVTSPAIIPVEDRLT